MNIRKLTSEVFAEDLVAEFRRENKEEFVRKIRSSEKSEAELIPSEPLDFMDHI